MFATLPAAIIIIIVIIVVNLHSVKLAPHLVWQIFLSFSLCVHIFAFWKNFCGEFLQRARRARALLSYARARAKRRHTKRLSFFSLQAHTNSNAIVVTRLGNTYIEFRSRTAMSSIFRSLATLAEGSSCYTTLDTRLQFRSLSSPHNFSILACPLDCVRVID